MMTIKHAKIEVKKYGYSLKKNTFGEYELKNVNTIYYTDDLKDAVNTAKFNFEKK